MKEPIELRYRNNWIGLVFKTQTDVFYTNQSGGHACLHPEIEGAFIPLRSEIDYDIADKLASYFEGDKWRCWCWEGIDAETADFIDRLLHDSQIRVDREQFGASYEAWIHCNILPPGNNDDPLPEGKGVLVWHNSD